MQTHWLDVNVFIKCGQDGTWTICTLDDSNLVNSDLIIYLLLVNLDLFTGQIGPREIRFEFTKCQMVLRSEVTKSQMALRSDLTKVRMKLISEFTNV